MSFRIAELWRYPVKSMLGERCDALHVETRGAQGDRLFAIRDRCGKLGSGKHTRLFRKVDGLFGFQASYCDGVPQIRFPDGTQLSGDAPSIHQALSDALGLEVTLAREAEISHFDSAPIHLLTSGSLAWLRTALPEAGIDARRFRPNLVIEVPGADAIEQSWIGKRLRIGEVELQVSDTTERCGMVAFAQGELPKAPRVLKHITRHADLKLGVYAQVVVPGLVRLNDAVILSDDCNWSGDHMTLRVVGAGLGRTGTKSLKLALEQLLGAPCYHMSEVFQHPEHVPLWHTAARGEPTDWHALFEGYAAAVDWPTGSFWPEISAAFPDALIVLSTRDAEAWWSSANATIFGSIQGVQDDPWRDMIDEMFRARFTPALNNKAACIAAYERHVAQVRRDAPRHRLLEWSPRAGWQPLCDALGVAVPDAPFPHVNSREEFLAGHAKH